MVVGRCFCREVVFTVREGEGFLLPLFGAILTLLGPVSAHRLIMNGWILG